jgi:manganese transport protein
MVLGTATQNGVAEAAGWRRARGRASLSEVFGTIATRPTGSFFKKLVAFLGPGYLVAVGYMDPGNWATSLAGGSKFGYALLTIALLSNIMAIILQALCARLGIGAERDLAQACRDAFPRVVAYPLWGLAEVAICATDLAEVIGTAIGLNLLFGVPLEIGVIITALDVFLILWLQNLGFRWIEAFIVTMLGVITVCFAIQIAMADPDWRAVIRGFAPTTEVVTNPDMLYLALGILGATVMPHNLYLHSGVVQTRRFGDSVPEKREAIKLASIDSTIALMFALLINASILILAAATFNKVGRTDVAELDQVHSFLAPLLGSAWAPTLFGIALLCCGMNSTVTATLSGQIVMEGFLDIRLPGWARRLITRGIAIVPLILSQVILSLQLPFAIVPLVMFTADRRKMGELTAPLWLTALAGITAAIVIVLNVKLLYDFVTG